MFSLRICLEYTHSYLQNINSVKLISIYAWIFHNQRKWRDYSRDKLLPEAASLADLVVYTLEGNWKFEISQNISFLLFSVIFWIMLASLAVFKALISKIWPFKVLFI